MNSNHPSDVEQGQLLLSRATPHTDVPLDLIMRRKTLLGAINFCMDLAGLDEKEIYLPLGIDAGHFSNVRKGKGHFPVDKIGDLMDLCKNEVPLIWQAHQRGYGLVVLKTEAERRLEVAERRAEEAEKRLAYAESLIARRATV